MSQSNTDALQSWLRMLSELMDDVSAWAEKLEWSTRRIEKTLDDRELGRHTVPALLMQKETVRVLLEPIARNAPGADGVVDLYLLPAYDDIASLYHEPGGWTLHYMFPDQEPVSTIRDAESQPLSPETFEKVVEEMVRHAV